MPLAPEIFLLGATCAILLVDLFVSAQRRGLVHFLALAALIATGILTFRASADVVGPVTAFGGMFVRDTMSDVLKLAVYVVAGEIGRASCRERVCQYVYISGVAVS